MGVPGVQYRNVSGEFFAALEAYTGSAWTSTVAMTINSDQPVETYGWLGQVAPMREWVGPRLLKGLTSQGITVTNKDWESTLLIDLKDWNYDKTGGVSIRVNELAVRAGELKSKLVTDLLVAGTSGVCYDGQYFFDSDHLDPGGPSSTTQTNLLTATEVTALGVTTAASPTVVEMNAAILGVIGKMIGYKDNQDEPMNAGARAWMVMVPVNMMASTLGAIYNPVITGAITNPIQAAMAAKGWNVSCEINPRLTTTTVFYVFRVDAPAKPVIHQIRKAASLNFIGPDSEFAFDNKAVKIGVDSEENVGYGYWQYAAHCTLS